MKFIYFIDASLKETVLVDGIFPSPNWRKINKESTGIFCYPLLKIPFKAPVLKDDYDDINDYLPFIKREQLLNESLSVQEAWEVVGAPRVKRRDPKVNEVSGAIFELKEKHWPITVFINIGHNIGHNFAQELEKNPNQGIHYGGYKNSLAKTVSGIKFKRYVIASAPFTVNTENDLLDLINRLKLAGGGIWYEDSFECMLTKNVLGENIEQVINIITNRVV